MEKEKAANDNEVQKNELVAVFDKYKKMGDDLAMEQQKELEAAKKAMEEAKIKVNIIGHTKIVLRHAPLIR